MRKKIVFLADCLITQKAGIHYYAKQFIQRVLDSYPDNDYYLVVPETYGKFNCKEIIIPIRSTIPLHLRIRNVWHIPKAMKKLSPDVVIELAHFGPFRLHNDIMRVTVIHDLTPILYPQWHDKSSHYVHRFFLRRILRQASIIIANSNVTCKEITAYAPSSEAKIRVVYPALKIDDNQNSIQNNESVYFLSVGTIEPRKNYVQLIDAFEIVAEEKEEVSLVIVGFKGWKSDPIYNKINKSKYKERIIIKGYIEEAELIDLYKGAIALIFPSLYEGFGLPLLESMTLGTLIICSDIPINKEVCEDAALYYNNTEALVNHMLEIKENPTIYNEKIQKGFKRSNAINSASLQLDEVFR